MGERTQRNKLNIVVLACMLGCSLAACNSDDADAIAPVAPAAADASANTPADANATPIITGSPSIAVTAGDTYSFQAAATDADGDMLTFSAQGLPDWATLDATTGRITGIPDDADAGETADISLSVTDGETTSSLPAFRIRIARRPTAAPSVPGQSAPTISGTPPVTAIAGTAYSFTPSGADADSLTLTFTIVNKPVWASFSTSTGKLSGTPGSTNVGSFANVIIGVSDGAKSASLPAFSIVVAAAPNRAPTISGAPASTVTAGSAYSFMPAAADPDKNALGFSITNKPSWASFSTATGKLSGTPAAANAGTYGGIVIGVNDGKATVALPAFAIVVLAAPNGAPVIAGSPPTGIGAGAPYSFRPTASDPNGNALTFSIANRPGWATFDTATGRLSGTPSISQVGSYAGVVITVSDGTLTASLPAFAVTVTQASLGSATLSWTPPTANTDGSDLTNLAGYRIYYGTSESALGATIQITNPGLTNYSIGNLGPGTHYFAIAAYTADGVEGQMSAIGSKTIM